MRRLSGLILLLTLVGPPSAGAATDDGPKALDVPVTLRFEDQDLVRVLEALVAATGLRVDIDPCVGGKVSITTERVSARAALDLLARMGNLDVRIGDAGEPVRISCRPREGTPLAAPAGSAEVTFTLQRVTPSGDLETVAEPRLASPFGMQATIEQSERLPVFDLNAGGHVYRRTVRPTLSIRAVFTEEGSGGLRVAAVIETSRVDPRDREAVQSVVKAGEVVLPARDTDGELTRFRLGGEEYVVTCRWD
jgi:type II secretory pathway component HofQ